MDDNLCRRCGQPIEGAAAVLAIERQGIPLGGSPLTLCAHCVASYERWLRKRQNPLNEARVQSKPAHSERRSPGHRSWRKKRRTLITAGFLVVALVSSFFLMTMLLHTFERGQPAAEAGP